MLIYAIRDITHPLVYGYIQAGKTKTPTADITKARLFPNLLEVIAFYQKQGLTDKYKVMGLELRLL